MLSVTVHLTPAFHLASRRIRIVRHMRAGDDTEPAAQIDQTLNGNVEIFRAVLPENQIWRLELLDTADTGEEAPLQLLYFHTGASQYPGPAQMSYRRGLQILHMTEESSSSHSSSSISTSSSSISTSSSSISESSSSSSSSVSSSSYSSQSSSSSSSSSSSTSSQSGSSQSSFSSQSSMSTSSASSVSSGSSSSSESSTSSLSSTSSHSSSSPQSQTSMSSLSSSSSSSSSSQSMSTSSQSASSASSSSPSSISLSSQSSTSYSISVSSPSSQSSTSFSSLSSSSSSVSSTSSLSSTSTSSSSSSASSPSSSSFSSFSSTSTSSWSSFSSTSSQSSSSSSTSSSSFSGSMSTSSVSSTSSPSSLSSTSSTTNVPPPQLNCQPSNSVYSHDSNWNGTSGEPSLATLQDDADTWIVPGDASSADDAQSAEVTLDFPSAPLGQRLVQQGSLQQIKVHAKSYYEGESPMDARLELVVYDNQSDIGVSQNFTITGGGAESENVISFAGNQIAASDGAGVQIFITARSATDIHGVGQVEENAQSTVQIRYVEFCMQHEPIPSE